MKDLKLPTDIPMTVMIARKIDADNDYVNKEMEYRIQYLKLEPQMNPKHKSSFIIQNGALHSERGTRIW